MGFDTLHVPLVDNGNDILTGLLIVDGSEDILILLIDQNPFFIGRNLLKIFHQEIGSELIK
jgi:hypothetical protein